MIEAPQQRGDGHVEHGKVFAQHVFVFEEYGCELRQAVANGAAGLFERFFVGLGGARFECRHVHEQFLLKIEQE
jgi:hypothetical protein